MTRIDLDALLDVFEKVDELTVDMDSGSEPLSAVQPACDELDEVVKVMLRQEKNLVRVCANRMLELRCRSGHG